MSADLIDLRAKITAQTHAVLCAISDARGIDMSELTREVLHEWASRRIDEARHIFGAIPDLTPITVDVPAPSPFKREPITNAMRTQIWTRDQGKCTYCGKVIDEGVSFHIDHVVPVSQGGGHAADNLALSCIGCNLQKAAKTPAQWAQGTTNPFIRNLTNG